LQFCVTPDALEAIFVATHVTVRQSCPIAVNRHGERIPYC